MVAVDDEDPAAGEIEASLGRVDPRVQRDGAAHAPLPGGEQGRASAERVPDEADRQVGSETVRDLLQRPANVVDGVWRASQPRVELSSRRTASSPVAGAGDPAGDRAPSAAPTAGSGLTRIGRRRAAPPWSTSAMPRGALGAAVSMSRACVTSAPSSRGVVCVSASRGHAVVFGDRASRSVRCRHTRSEYRQAVSRVAQG